MEGFKYRAFISYSHADEAWAKWLHQRLERYRVPSRLVGRTGQRGIVPRKIGRCFRDQAELSAASHLGETLQRALQSAQSLIIVCSPRSAASHWVNEEVKYFRSLGRDDQIYALIVDGEPDAEDASQRCFPPALQEPMAADARAGRDGKTDAFLKLAAALIGVGFDELRRREQRRRARLVVATVAASLSIAAATTVLAMSAYRARNEAQVRRQQADDLIDFMLGDLRDKLDPVGRLDVLDAAVGKLMDYLGRGADASLDDQALAQRIRALVAIADIRGTRDQMPEATDAAQRAVAAARALKSRHASDSGYLLALALECSARAHLGTEHVDASDAEIAQAREELATLKDAAIRDADLTYLTGEIDSDAGDAARDRGEWPSAFTAYSACAHRLQPMSASDKATSRQVRTYLACEEESALMLLMHMPKRRQEAIETYQRLLAGATPLLALHADDPTLLAPEADIASGATYALKYENKMDEAQAASRQALEFSHRLVRHDSTNVDWLAILAGSLMSEAFLQSDLKNWAAMKAALDEEIPIHRELLEHNPAGASQRMWLMQALGLRSESLEHLGDRSSAIADLEAVIAAGGENQDPQVRLDEFDAWLQIGYVAFDAEPERAARARRNAERILAELESDPASPTQDWQNGTLPFARMRLLYLQGNVQAADAIFRQLMQASGGGNVARMRSRDCAWLARHPGPHCASIDLSAPHSSTSRRSSATTTPDA